MGQAMTVSLPPREAWIEMLPELLFLPPPQGRFPRGKRGLKSGRSLALWGFLRSLPPREAWIEIRCFLYFSRTLMSLPPREAWIEIIYRGRSPVRASSLPPREAWIEICFRHTSYKHGRSLPPREAWIEIKVTLVNSSLLAGRFPRGKRGLKSVLS